jgi:molecular chaperone GrpE
MSESESAELAQLTEEVASLRELFQRRLLEDKGKQQLYDELYRQLQFAQKGLVEQFIAPMTREVLLVVDRLDSTAEHVSEESKQLLASVREELLEVLARRGLRPVDAWGEQFDPRQHEAVGRVAVPNRDQVGRVVEVRRLGYLLENRLVRPAQVVVGYLPAETSEA